LVTGSSPQAYTPADQQRDLAKAQRYYAKTFAQGVAPVTAVGNNQGCLMSVGTTAVGLATHWRFPVDMRAAPTIVTYNPFVADANWRDTGNTVSETASVNTANTSGVGIRATTNVNNLQGTIHATANARLT